MFSYATTACQTLKLQFILASVPVLWEFSPLSLYLFEETGIASSF